VPIEQVIAAHLDWLFPEMAIVEHHPFRVTLPETKLTVVQFAGNQVPAPPHFYQDYGPDYDERYQWRFPPTTGAFEVRDGGIVKGASITQHRVRNWWARDLKYYRYRFNPDRLVNIVI